MTAQTTHPRALGLAALYLASALVAAMLYFLVATDAPAVSDPAAQVDVLVQDHLGLHVMYLVAYVGFGLVLAVLALGLQARLVTAAPATARLAGAIGLVWAAMLVASGMVYIVGMGSVIDLHESDPAAAVAAWQAIYPVSLGLGGAGGEVLGGTWVLLVSLASLRARALPRWLGRFGLVAGVAGIGSTVPGLLPATMLFGLLVIVWLAALGIVLLRTRPDDVPAAQALPLADVNAGR